MSNRQPPSNDELEVAEAKNPLVDLLYDYTAQALMSRIGNYVYHRFDACLAIVEKTAKWSLPQPPPSEEDSSKTSISAPPLVRPLPWIFFLPALIALRLLRCVLSFIALLIGKQPVNPITMVTFLQNRRRKLRALKYRGLKLQRMQQAEHASEEAVEQQMSNTWLRRITLPLRYIICFKTVRPGATIRHHHHHHRHHQQESRELANEPATNGSEHVEARDRSTTKKRNVYQRDAEDSDSSFDEATVQELLEKYASAEADSSFHASDTSSSSSNSDIQDSDKSLPEEAENAEEHDPKKIKKESNGHATSHDKELAAKSEKPQESKQKSTLNTTVNNGKSESKPAEPVPENGNVAKKETSEQKPTADPQKTTPANGDQNEMKPLDANKSGKEQPPEDASSRNDSHNATNKQSHSSMKEVKSNFHQRNKQQQYQPQQPQQPHQQPQPQQPNQLNQQQQQQYTTANGGGTGGRKQKKLQQYNAQHN